MESKITLEARWKIRIKIEQININDEYVINKNQLHLQ